MGPKKEETEKSESGKKQTRAKAAIAVAVAIAAVGAFRLGSNLFFFINSAPQASRAPAEVPRQFDYSQMSGDELTVAAQQRLITGAKVVTAGDSKGISIGLFEAKDANGLPTNACNLYDHIELTFYADDMAVDGQPCVMVLDSTCLPDSDDSVSSPVLIEYGKVIGRTPQSTTVKGFVNPNVTATFKNVSDGWPHIWVLHDVKLYNSKTSAQIVVDSNLLRQLESSPLQIQW